MRVLILFPGSAGYYPYCAGKGRRLLTFLTENGIDREMFEYSGKSSGTLLAVSFSLGIPSEEIMACMRSTLIPQSSNTLASNVLTILFQNRDYLTAVERIFGPLWRKYARRSLGPGHFHLSVGKKRGVSDYQPVIISDHTSLDDVMETVLTGIYVPMITGDQQKFRFHKVRKFYGCDPIDEAQYADLPDDDYDLKIYVSLPTDASRRPTLADWIPSLNPALIEELYERGCRDVTEDRMRSILKAFQNKVGCQKFNL